MPECRNIIANVDVRVKSTLESLDRLTYSDALDKIVKIVFALDDALRMGCYRRYRDQVEKIKTALEEIASRLRVFARKNLGDSLPSNMKSEIQHLLLILSSIDNVEIRGERFPVIDLLEELEHQIERMNVTLFGIAKFIEDMVYPELDRLEMDVNDLLGSYRDAFLKEINNARDKLRKMEELCARDYSAVLQGNKKKEFILEIIRVKRIIRRARNVYLKFMEESIQKAVFTGAPLVSEPSLKPSGVTIEKASEEKLVRIRVENEEYIAETPFIIGRVSNVGGGWMFSLGVRRIPANFLSNLVILMKQSQNIRFRSDLDDLFKPVKIFGFSVKQTIGRLQALIYTAGNELYLSNIGRRKITVYRDGEIVETSGRYQGDIVRIGRQAEIYIEDLPIPIYVEEVKKAAF